MRAIDFQLRVQTRRFLVGRSAGIGEKTALIELSISGHPGFEAGFDAAIDQRIRSAALELCPEQPMFGVAETDWPKAFLVNAPDSGNESGSWLGRWVVALTVAIQRWGRDPVWRGRVVRAEPQRLVLAIPWQRQHLCTEALDLALEVIHRCVQPRLDELSHLLGSWFGSESPLVSAPALRLSTHFGRRWEEILTGGLAPNTLRFIQAGIARGMPFDVLPSYVQLGWGANAERFDMAFTGGTGWMASALARDKWKCKRTLADQAVPVPRGWLVGDVDQADAAANDLGWPVVIKPSNRELGLGVVVGIPDAATLHGVFDRIAQLSPGNVIVERHIDGHDHRLLVVGGRYVAAVRRVPGGVTGDGVHSVEELVAVLNADVRRGTNRYSLLKVLAFDEEACDCLAEQGLDAHSVPERGRRVALRRIANISSGGTAEDVTDSVHPDNRVLVERAARIVGLDIAGIDFLTTDITRSWQEVGGAINEVNAQPGFRPHWLADPERDINGEVLEVIFAGRPTRIPTAAITGTNGKSTTAEMLYHIWMTAKKLTAVTTTTVLRIGTGVVSRDNLSGQPGARIILNDPTVESAIFEMPRKGLIIFGHPCDYYDVAALLNIQDDHIGVDGIETLQQMAELKAEVLERARHAIVVNADDPLCMAMRSRAGTRRHILVAGRPTNAAVVEHRRCGGEAVFVDHRGGTPYIVLAAGDHEEVLMPVDDIPATMNGLLRFNESNAQFAAALAWAQGIDTGTIRRALGSFHNSVEQNPGRYNFIEGLPFDLLLDYAHNPDGVREICSVAAALPVAGRRILCNRNVGNRHAAHISAVAGVLSESFDEFVLGCNPPFVARSGDYVGADPVAAMLSMTRQCLLDAGVQPDCITSQPDPDVVIPEALALARPGDLVVVLAEPEDTLPAVEAVRQHLMNT